MMQYERPNTIEYYITLLILGEVPSFSGRIIFERRVQHTHHPMKMSYKFANLPKLFFSLLKSSLFYIRSRSIYDFFFFSPTPLFFDGLK
mmetsp:Transcript_29918/g.47966  ORF Transcript_29918/g.47966 Transcript_29918/m.47966 type:complete len:89 (+) Transcript_29918:261-527(+)